MTVVDIGVDHDFGDAPGLVVRKVARGTSNMARGPAMARAVALKAMEVGCELAYELIGQGADISSDWGKWVSATPTASSAITSVITGRPVREVTGTGHGY